MAAMNGTARTITALKRWSCQDKQLPEIADIKAIHIYDFDNTLFSSPLPNKQVWNGSTIGSLQAIDFFAGGGWWHDKSILASTGKGMEEEEPRAWEGWWNESIVDLVRLTMQQQDALNVLLTGRKESAFADIISRMTKAKGLEFDMVCLKPEVGPANQKLTSTMMFKQELLKDLVFTYAAAGEVRLYEDRPRHTQGFRDFFETLNESLARHNTPASRPPFQAEVVQVTEQAVSLDPVTEIAAIQRMINNHNTAVLAGKTSLGTPALTIKRNVFFTAYLITPADSERLKTLVKAPNGGSESEMRYLANSILITPRPADSHILNKVGGMGKKVAWRVTGLGVYDNKLWAARVAPVNARERVYSENSVPCIVLAIRRNARPVDANRISSWQPVSDSEPFELETTVGEKAMLRVEEERRGEDEWDNKFPRQNGDRQQYQSRHEDFPPLGSENVRNDHGSRYNDRTGRGGYRAQRGSSNRGGRGGRGGHGRGRGRQGPSYRSLDDNASSGYGQGGGMQY